MNEIYRVLAAGGVFRLSVPDYRYSALKSRSVYDWRGKVIADTMMGAKVGYNAKSGTTNVELSKDGNAQLWFPTYEAVLDLIVRSEIRKCKEITFYQYYRDDDNYVCDEVPDKELFVTRSHPHDPRSAGKPISIIVDFTK